MDDIQTIDQRSELGSILSSKKTKHTQKSAQSVQTKQTGMMTLLKRAGAGKSVSSEMLQRVADKVNKI